MDEQSDSSDRSIELQTTRLTPMQMLTIRRERLFWSRHADSWEREGAGGVTRVVDAVLAVCGDVNGMSVVDLGCGSGHVTIPLARRCTHMLAVDISAPSVALLEAKARGGHITSIQTSTRPIETLEMQPESVDLVVSNYALHHLRNPDKEELLRRAIVWLRPGGRLVIGDMMFGRGAQPGDRAIIATKVRAMIGRGPAGWWRILRNVVRFTLRLREKPLPAATWEAIARHTGFEQVRSTRVVAEACVLSAVKPVIPPSRAPRIATSSAAQLRGSLAA
jgi:2-polyprenyl-3-methyl-5-hydroxy-6-metoxy-1,4-benzoquinol methylase